MCQRGSQNTRHRNRRTHRRRRYRVAWAAGRHTGGRQRAEARMAAEGPPACALPPASEASVPRRRPGYSWRRQQGPAGHRPPPRGALLLIDASRARSGGLRAPHPEHSAVEDAAPANDPRMTARERLSVRAKKVHRACTADGADSAPRTTRASRAVVAWTEIAPPC